MEAGGLMVRRKNYFSDPILLLLEYGVPRISMTSNMQNQKWEELKVARISDVS